MQLSCFNKSFLKQNITSLAMTLNIQLLYRIANKILLNLFTCVAQPVIESPVKYASFYSLKVLKRDEQLI